MQRSSNPPGPNTSSIAGTRDFSRAAAPAFCVRVSSPRLGKSSSNGTYTRSAGTHFASVVVPSRRLDVSATRLGKMGSRVPHMGAGPPSLTIAHGRGVPCPRTCRRLGSKSLSNMPSGSREVAPNNGYSQMRDSARVRPRDVAPWESTKWGIPMKRALLALCAVSFATLSVTAARHQLFRATTPAPFYSQPERSTPSRGEVLTAYGKLPLNFEANQGQTDARVRFLAHGSGYTVFLTGDDATLLLQAPCAENAISLSGRSGLASNSKSSRCPAAAVRLALAGASPHVEIEALDAQSGASNYLTGNDPSKWVRGVPHFARIKYNGVYPGVDLVYYGNQGRLESDYVLAPGAAPSQIGIRIQGADKFKLDSQG